MTYRIERAAVLGAGTMGAAIAAHLANAGIPSLLLDVVPTELTEEEKRKGLGLAHPEVRNRIVCQGWQRCLKARPANLFSQSLAGLVEFGNLEDDFGRLAEADWIIEAVVERLEIKIPLMERLEAVRKPGSIVSTNTSGLPIRQVAEGRSADFKAHFLGTHFFNPPRYLKLLELIPGDGTDPELVSFMREFAETRLGKGVVMCKDTPNFIANRFFSIVGTYTVNYALEHGYSIEEVDELTGPVIGYPKTATFRLLDLVGIDVMAHVGGNLHDAIAADPCREVLRNPRSRDMVEGLVQRGWLGNKSGQGFYKRVEVEGGKEFWHLDPQAFDYLPPAMPRFESVGKHKDIEDPGERLKALCSEHDRAGEFLWAITAFGVNYAASVIPEIADDIPSIDNANQWGFMHELGPFERWDALGVREAVARMQAEGKPVTPWVLEMLEAGAETFYQREAGQVVGYYDPPSKRYVPLRQDPRIISIDALRQQGRERQSNGSASLLDLGDGVLLLEFHSPAANALDEDIFKMAETALAELEKPEWAALVVGNQGKHFCAGANIFPMAVAAQQGQLEYIDQAIRTMQSLLQRMRASPKPIVVAVHGMALGGGVEVLMAGTRAVAAAESYIGLVEMGVGLIPAGTGTKEVVRRLINPVMQTEGADVLPHLQKAFEQIALAKVAESAQQAREMGYLGPADRIVMNSDHLLAEAKQEALALAAQQPRPAHPRLVWAAGGEALAALRMGVWSMRQAGYASEHDAVIANQLARVLTGGELTRPGWVHEQHLLDLEREAFLSLCAEPKTQERMWHMLQHKKPLRN
jgi:3-hydroxyacyl-CoA dehydrogenase